MTVADAMEAFFAAGGEPADLPPGTYRPERTVYLPSQRPVQPAALRAARDELLRLLDA